jgi:hypothetical protein
MALADPTQDSNSPDFSPMQRIFKEAFALEDAISYKSQEVTRPQDRLTRLIELHVFLNERLDHIWQIASLAEQEMRIEKSLYDYCAREYFPLACYDTLGQNLATAMTVLEEEGIIPPKTIPKPTDETSRMFRRYHRPESIQDVREFRGNLQKILRYSPGIQMMRDLYIAIMNKTIQDIKKQISVENRFAENIHQADITAALVPILDWYQKSHENIN